MEGMPPDNGYLPPPSSVQIKTAKTQKHLYCLVFTQNTANFRCLCGFAVFLFFKNLWCKLVRFGLNLT